MIITKVIKFHNARGGEEKNFDVLNNNFIWSNMPFSFLNENTVIYKYLAN
ncbi:MAG: hypothetical protein QMD02_09465 [Bacteroidales bacterium]|nr:hypothetical protein [Bacteroidales bacterium]